MPPHEWATAMRVRLGADVVVTERVCRACGERVLDQQGYHALCCAKGESTKGHYRVRDELAAAFAEADPTVACEVSGLAPSRPELRPADVLTWAAHPSKAVAVDVMVKAPNATGAGHDCTEAGKREKLDHYGDILGELERQGIVYAPAVFSAYGRRHPDVTKMLLEAARRAARHRGCATPNALMRRWCARLGVAVWRRAANMVHRWLLPADGAAGSHHPEEAEQEDGEDDEWLLPSG